MIQPPTRSRPVWQLLAAYGVLALIVLYPVMVVQVPDLTDYPNHLARMHILANIDHSEALRRFYQAVWQPIPYLSMDAAFVVLRHVGTIYDAGRIFVGICVLLPVASVAALHFAVTGRRSLIPTAAFLLCYNKLLYMGFLNYLAAICLATMVFAGWIATAGWPRGRRAALFALLGFLLYLCHLVAFGAYGLMVGMFELSRAVRVGFRPWRTIGLDWLAAALPLVPVAVAVRSVTMEPPFVGPIIGYFYGSPLQKLNALLSPVMFDDRSGAMVIAGGALVGFAIGHYSGRLRMAGALQPVVIAVGLMAVCAPTWLLGIFGIDLRLPLLVAILLVGTATFAPMVGRWPRRAVLVVIVALVLGRTLLVAADMREADRQIAEIRQMLQSLPRGVRLLTIDVSDGDRRLRDGAMNVSWHAPLLAVIDRDALVPTLFTMLMVVKFAPDFRQSTTDTGWPYPSLHDLVAGYGGKDDPAGDRSAPGGGRVYWTGWENKFDYVMIEHYRHQAGALPAILKLVARSEVADLYKIDR